MDMDIENDYWADKEIIVKELENAIKNKASDEKIIFYAYKNLCFGRDLLNIVQNYIALDKVNINFDFGHRIIKKGTILYRIRNYKDGIDYSNIDEWKPNPNRKRNRANKEGEEALYLGSTERVCILEMNLKHGEKYALGRYECLEDICVGGFLNFTIPKSSQSYQLQMMAGIVLNAFLIAPSRGNDDELFEFLDGIYKQKGIRNDDWKHNFDLPYKFASLNNGPNLYDMENMVCDVLKKRYPQGILYSSCYLPVATIGIGCSDYNIVLYEEAIKRLKFLDYEVKSNKEKFSRLEIAKVCTEIARNVKRSNNEQN